MSISQRTERVHRWQRPRRPYVRARRAVVLATGIVLGVASLAAPYSLTELPAAADQPTVAEQPSVPVPDGMSEVELVADISPGSPGSIPGEEVVMGGRIYVVADDGFSRGIWSSDGTREGTQLIARLDDYGSASLTVVGDMLYFTTVSGTAGYELWRTDGTPGGAMLVMDSFFSRPVELTAVGDLLYFVHFDRVVGSQVWRTDGTAAGTVQVSRLETGGEGDPDFPRLVHGLTAMDDEVFFVAAEPDTGYELWRTDGTASGTAMVKDIGGTFGPPGTRDGASYPYVLTVVGTALYFTADDHVHGRELWRSDGTASGTQMVADTAPANSGDYTDGPYLLGALGSTLFFSVRNSFTTRDLWTTDGTLAGTKLLADLNPHGDTTDASDPIAQPVELDGYLYFSAFEPEHGRELWRSDGTPAGTTQVADLRVNPRRGDAGSRVADITRVGDTLFFQADHGGHGFELWRSDGTAAGTGLVFGTTGLPVNVRNLTGLGGALLFWADDGLHGLELMRTTQEADVVPVVANLALPVVSGRLVVGSRLTATAGEWGTPGVSVDYQWIKDASHSWDSPIRDARAPSLTLVYSHERDLITVQVVASRPGYHSTEVRSEFTERVKAAAWNDERPTITGVPAVGSTLTATPGTWTQTEDWQEHPTVPFRGPFLYQWYAGRTAIRGADGPTFTVPESIAGQSITVAVLTDDYWVDPTVALSTPTSPVAAGVLRLAARPRVVGQTRVGRTLRVAPGRSTPTATRVSYVWLRAGRRVAGSAGSSYRLGADDRGRRLAVRVTYARVGHRPLVVVTVPTAKVRRR
jgi:ELWxxDGT repeat protein